ncbi:MAG: ATP-binding protein [Polyangia bacterium]
MSQGEGGGGGDSKLTTEGMDANHLEAALGALRNPLAYLLPVRGSDGHPVDFQLTWANPSYVALFAPGDDSIGRPVSQTMRSPWKAQLLPAYIAAFADQRSRTIELTIDIDGRRFDFVFSVLPTEAALGISVEDHTKRKRAEAELALTTTLLRGVTRLQERFLADQPVHVVFASVLALAMETTASTYGYIGELVAGDDELRVHAMDDTTWDSTTRAKHRGQLALGMRFEHVDAVWTRVRNTGEPVIHHQSGEGPREGGFDSVLALPIRRGDKLLGLLGLANRSGGYEHIWISRLEPLLAATGALLDATTQAAARRRVEAELRRSEELLREAQEIAALGAFSYPLPIAGAPGRWTEQMYRLLGIPLEEAPWSLRKTARLLATDESRPQLYELYDNVSRDGERRHVDAAFVIEGTARHLQIVLRGRRGPDGVLVEVNGTLKDVTERKHVEAARIRFEQQLAETQRLESLGLLAGGIAHDVNNLLVGVLANASLIKDELPSEDVHHEAAAEIEMAARRMAELTRQILDYAGRSRVAPQPLDLNALISETVQLVRRTMPQAAKVDLALSTEPMIVEADAAQLRQVVMNLVINAGEALAGRPGDVRIETHPEEESGTSARAIIVVSDTGVGMDADVHRRIFDPFFTTKEKGRGLGLSAVHGIIRRMGGTITVTSQPLRGTQFRVALPLSERRALATATPAARSVRTKRLRVLVVDDEAVVRSAVERMLARMDCEVTLADGGHVALHHFAAHPSQFDVVLLDVLMPYLSGADVLREIRRIAPAQRVVMMSGFVGGDEEATLSADGFLRKPFTREELEALLAPP